MFSMLKGYAFALLPVFLWSFNIIYAKILVGYVTPVQISFIRWGLALLIFLPFTFREVWNYRKKIMENFEYILIMGLTGIGWLNTFIYYAGHTANAIDMALIGMFGPIILMILAYFFAGENIGFRGLLGIIFSIFGVLIIISHGSIAHFEQLDFVRGDLWMLGAAFMFAIYSLAQKKVSHSIPQLVVITVAIIISVLSFLPSFVEQLFTNPIAQLPAKIWGILLILGFLNSALAYWCWNVSIKKIGLIHTGMIYYIMPLFSVIEAYIFLGTTISVAQLYGAVLVVLGIVLGLYKNQQNKKYYKVKQRVLAVLERK